MPFVLSGKCPALSHEMHLPWPGPHHCPRLAVDWARSPGLGRVSHLFSLHRHSSYVRAVRYSTYSITAQASIIMTVHPYSVQTHKTRAIRRPGSWQRGRGGEVCLSRWGGCLLSSCSRAACCVVLRTRRLIQPDHAILGSLWQSCREHDRGMVYKHLPHDFRIRPPAPFASICAAMATSLPPSMPSFPRFPTTYLLLLSADRQRPSPTR